MGEGTGLRGPCRVSLTYVNIHTPHTDNVYRLWVINFTATWFCNFGYVRKYILYSPPNYVCPGIFQHNRAPDCLFISNQKGPSCVLMYFQKGMLFRFNGVPRAIIRSLWIWRRIQRSMPSDKCHIKVQVQSWREASIVKNCRKYFESKKYISGLLLKKYFQLCRLFNTIHSNKQENIKYGT